MTLTEKALGILRRMQKEAKEVTTAPSLTVTPPKTTLPNAHHQFLADDDEHEEYSPVGIDGLLASTEKLLAVNRGLEKTDDRDASSNDRVYTVDRLMGERIKLDHGKTLRALMGRSSRRRNLSALGPAAFDAYTVDYLKGNPLASAIEEINPMNIMEQRRRITKMGPGGIGDSNAITVAMQCHSADTEVFTKQGWKPWPEVKPTDSLACRIDGVLEFHEPDSLHSYDYAGAMHLVAHKGVGFMVTPGHRFWSASSTRTSESGWRWETAEDQTNKHRAHACSSAPYAGSDKSDLFELPAPVARPSGYNLKDHGALDMGDWCEFLGWYAAEGSSYQNDKNSASVTITQCPAVNPEKWARIHALLGRMGFNVQDSTERNFKIYSRALFEYLAPLGKALVKTLPDFLFEVRPEYRRRFLDAFLQGDGWTQKSGGGVYSTSSPALADQLERLLVLTGSAVTRGTPWLAKWRDGSAGCWMHRANELKSRHAYVVPWQRQVVHYEGKVYCATVPGSLLLTRINRLNKPIWTGNSVHSSQFGFISPIEGPESERAGIDVRLAHGARIGSDGRIYQIMRNAKTGKKEWVSPSQLQGKTLRLPD